MYQIATDIISGAQSVVLIENMLWIPMSDDNSDYQAYLAWVAEGNTPEKWETE